MDFQRRERRICSIKKRTLMCDLPSYKFLNKLLTINTDFQININMCEKSKLVLQFLLKETFKLNVKNK